MYPRLSRAAGFTLTELLIVMVVIGALIGLLVPVIGVVRKKAQRASTLTFMQGVAAGLETYFEEFGEYPPSNIDGLNGDVQDDSLYRFLCGEEGRGLIKNKGKDSEKFLKPFVDVPPEFLRSVNGKRMICDVWGQPLKYLNCKYHIQTGGDPEACHSKKFDMYSTGPDREKDPKHDNKDSDNNQIIDDQAELVDDVTSWNW